jgi:hypothetical protein
MLILVFLSFFVTLTLTKLYFAAASIAIRKFVLRQGCAVQKNLQLSLQYADFLQTTFRQTGRKYTLRQMYSVKIFHYFTWFFDDARREKIIGGPKQQLFWLILSC